MISGAAGPEGQKFGDRCHALRADKSYAQGTPGRALPEVALTLAIPPPSSTGAARINPLVRVVLRRSARLRRRRSDRMARVLTSAPCAGWEYRSGDAFLPAGFARKRFGRAARPRDVV
jgi:hypothetical protein